jgi:hypothetical protein
MARRLRRAIVGVLLSGAGAIAVRHSLQSSTVSGYAGTSVVMGQLAAAKGISLSAAHGVRADYRVSAGQAQSMAQALTQLATRNSRIGR